MRWVLAAGAAAVLVAAGAAALDWVFPPDLSRHRDRSTLVLDADDRILRAYTTTDGMWRLATAPHDVDPRYLAMLRAYEDRRFDRHPGVDPLAVARAAWQFAVERRVVSGASTLTMQTARLLQPHRRNLAGKLVEAARALQLETRYRKDEVLAIYLTLAPFGGNLEGVRAATFAWFGKEPRHLTTAQAALLVALPQSPERLRPDLHPEAARAARNKVLRRMVAAGVLSAAEGEEPAQEPVPTRRRAMPFRAPHLADDLRVAEAPGAVIATTIDGRLQRQIEELAQRERSWLGDGANMAVVVVQNRDRQVRAWLGGVDYFMPQGQIDLARARRSPGSALKPFIYGIAFDDGIAHPETLVDDAPVRFGDYAPRNFDRGFQGQVTLRAALQQSLNVPAVVALNRIGPARFVGALRQAGAVLEFDRMAAEVPALPVALGGVAISLADLTMLYADLADGGRAQLLVTRRGLDGARAGRLFGASASWQVADILRGVLPPEPWAQITRTSAGSRQIAYKTGTSYGFRDGWALGFSDAWTVGVWTGRADGTPRPDQYARATAAPILFKIFDLLPSDGEAPSPPPADVLIASGPLALPPGLRVLRGAEPDMPSAVRRASPPQILFPPDGATVEIVRHADAFDALALKAEGGSGALVWIVNGVPLPDNLQRRETFWRPEGEGFARIVVMDETGRSARAQLRVQPTDAKP